MQGFGQGLTVLSGQRMSVAQQIEQRQQAEAADVMAEVSVRAGDAQQGFHCPCKIVSCQQTRCALKLRGEIFRVLRQQRIEFGQRGRQSGGFGQGEVRVKPGDLGFATGIRWQAVE